jgi:hypothetical protein
LRPIGTFRNSESAADWSVLTFSMITRETSSGMRAAASVRLMRLS